MNISSDNNLTRNSMVIQRWQSVWLLVAAICVALFSFLPMADAIYEVTLGADGTPLDPVKPLLPIDFPILATVAAVVFLLLVITIFMYRNTARQKTLIKVSVMLAVVLAISAFLTVKQIDTTIEWESGLLFPLGTIAFALLAHHCINQDEKLLKAADRLR
jgi:hypothetical protein